MTHVITCAKGHEQGPEFDFCRACSAEDATVALRREIADLTIDVNRLRGALHVAYDWMGRAAEDASGTAHLQLAEERVVAALGTREKDPWH